MVAHLLSKEKMKQMRAMLAQQASQ